MKKLRISIPVIIALLTSLALMTMGKPGRDSQPAESNAVEPKRVIQASAPAVAATEINDRNFKPKRAPARESTALTTPKAAKPEVATYESATEQIDWIAALYPELAGIAQLEEQDADSSLQGLIALLASDDPVIRLAALESVADMNHAAKLPSLFAALDDPSAQIRIAALEALVLHGDPAASSAIESLVYDQDPAVRAAAVDALAVLASPASIPVLAGLLYDPDRQVRINAVAALGEIGGDDAIGYLRQLRYDPDESIRVSANAILDEEAAAGAF